MTWRAAVVGFALLACAHAAGARQLPEARAALDGDGRWVNGVTESWWLGDGITPAEGAAAAALWKEIGEGLAPGGAAGWAGDYFRGGDTHGSYLRWSPRGFVIAHVDKCAALVMGLTYGRVEAMPALVRFLPDLDKRPAGRHGHGGDILQAAAPRDVIRYLPVEWRGKRLFISEVEMEGFGEYVAGLGSYNGDYVGHFLEYEYFFRGPDLGGKDGARPVVPAGYERFIKSPIEARVTSVGRKELKRDYTVEGAHTSATYERASVTHVTINAGTEQGVKDGLVFRVTRPGEGDTVLVTRAGRRTSQAVVVRDVDARGVEYFFDSESREHRHTRVARGWRLTTAFVD